MADFRTPFSELTQSQDRPNNLQEGLNFSNTRPLLNVPELKDYASDPKMVARAIQEIWPLIDQTRSDRRRIEDEMWAPIRRMSEVTHDQNQKYIGRSNAYLPLHSKNLATQNTQLMRGLFPTDDYLDCVSRSQSPTASLNAKHYMLYQFERIAYLRTHMQLFGRQLLDFGFSVLKYWYRHPKPYGTGKKKKMTLDLLASMTETQVPDYGIDTEDQGLTVSTRNIEHFYAYPQTVATLREATLQFEDIEMSLAELLYWAECDKWPRMDVLDHAPKLSSISPAVAEREEAFMLQDSATSGSTKLGDRRAVTECYTFMELPSSEYTGNEVRGCPLPVRIIFLGSEPVSIKRNHIYTQQTPWLGLSINASPGRLYGYGPGKMIAPLQYLANDFANQVNDVCMYGLNPGVKIIPGKIVGELAPLAPGVTWGVQEQDAIEFFHPPVDQLQIGMAMIQMISQQVADLGGSPPISQGTRAAKTATSSQILQQNASAPLQIMVEQIEHEVLVPLMSNAWKLAQQYAPDKILATVYGITREITSDDLLFNATWQWLASTQATNQQARAQAGIQFLGALLPVAQALGAQGMKINFQPILERLASNMGFGQVKDLIVPMGPMDMMPGGPAGINNAATGAIEGGAPQPVPQDDQSAFNDVRAEAEGLSAQFGGEDAGY